MRFTNFKILRGEGSCAGQLAQVHGSDGDIWFAGGRFFTWINKGEKTPVFEASQGNCFAARQDAEELQDEREAAAMAYFNKWGTASE